jgi:hypothetical protein
MKNYGLAALAAALVFACGAVAWMGYQRLGAPRSGAPAPVQAITAAPMPSPSARAAAASPSPTQAPVVFVPAETTAAPSAAPATAGPVASPAPSGVATPAPSPKAATPEPLEAASASPTSVPVPVVTLAPHAALPGVIKESPGAPPRILAMSLSTPVAHGGDVVSGFVETSSNVASVEARIAGYSSVMRKIGVGKFVLSYKVPNLPFFLHRTYTIQVIARNTRGESVTSSLPITIR